MKNYLARIFIKMDLLKEIMATYRVYYVVLSFILKIWTLFYKNHHFELFFIGIPIVHSSSFYREVPIVFSRQHSCNNFKLSLILQLWSVKNTTERKYYLYSNFILFKIWLRLYHSDKYWKYGIKHDKPQGSLFSMYF